MSQTSPSIATTVATAATGPAAVLERVRPLVAGLAASAAIAAAAAALGWIPSLQAAGLGLLPLSILLGAIAGNLGARRFGRSMEPGLAFTRQALLRIGIVVYGFRLTLQDIDGIGAAGILVDAMVIAGTFGLAVVIGTRLGLDRRLSMLVGAGSAICGAAAVLATGPVVRARSEQVAVAVATVVCFGTIAVFVYPWLHASAFLGAVPTLDPLSFGIFAGSTIHEVAQVVAATQHLGATVADAAIVTKMVRVMMLAPFLLALSAWLARADRADGADGTDGAGPAGGAAASVRRPGVPGFAIAFVAVVVLNSWLAPAPALQAALRVADMTLLAAAMAALGASTRFAAIRSAGLRPMLLAAVLAAWLVVGGALLNLAVTAWFR